MLTIALIGPDGAGKTTACRRLERELGLPARYVYMGINLETSKVVLPTTWLWLQIRRACGKRPDMGGPPDPRRAKPPARGLVRRTARGLKSALRLANQVAEEWFRQAVVWSYRRRGYVVLLDRHFWLDYYFADIAHIAHTADTAGQPDHSGPAPPDSPCPPPAGRSWASRLHGLVLDRCHPRPDLVICLDAPGEVLWARKPEGRPEWLEQRRQQYHQLQAVVEHFVMVDATRTEQEVIEEVRQLIHQFRNKAASRYEHFDFEPHR